MVPIENLSEGFVSPVVDAFVHRPLTIQAELRLPIEFKLLANSNSPQGVWAQFVAAGQCRKTLAANQLPITHTSSNSGSLQQLIATHEPMAALVPAHIGCPPELMVLQSRCADTAHNQTRFVLLSADEACEAYDPNSHWKSSVLLIDDDDHPGLLVDSLSIFARRAINLTSIVSRPTGGRFGQYHFFIEFDGHIEQAPVREAVDQLKKLNKLQWLGSYRSIDNEYKETP